MMVGVYDLPRLTVTTALLALLGLTWLVFQPALSGPFVFDDFPNLRNLAQIGGELSPESIRRYLASYNGNPGRPLATLSFLIEDSAWPAYPADYKRNNLLFHLLVGLLVFALARAVARRLQLPPLRADWLALAVAALWLLHPIQLSATMLVVQRMNILSTLFMLLGLLAYLRLLAATHFTELIRIVLAGIALALFGGLGFLCKENGVLVFAYATVLNITVLREPIGRYAASNRWLLMSGVGAPLLLMMAGALANSDAILAGYRFRDFDLGERLLTESRILIDYIRLILLPRLGGLGVFHDDYGVSRGLLQPPTTLMALLTISGLLGSAIGLRKRAPVFAFAVLWFFAGHLLESTVVALELYFEHRNYLPMVGPLFALAYFAVSVSRPWRPVARSLLIVWVAVFAGLAWMSAAVWGDRGTLALVWLAENPASVRAVQMVASYQNDYGDYPGASETLDEGIRRIPDAKELVFQRVLLDCFHVGVSTDDVTKLRAAARNAVKPGAIPEVMAILIKEAIGNKCRDTLKREELRGVITDLMRNPALSSDYAAMGFLHYELSKLALEERDLDQLMFHLDESYRYRPSPLIPREQAIYLLSAGLPEDALAYLARSDATSMPLVKRLLLDMPTRNASLRRNAREMAAAKDQHGTPILQ